MRTLKKKIDVQCFGELFRNVRKAVYGGKPTIKIRVNDLETKDWISPIEITSVSANSMKKWSLANRFQ